MRSRAHASGGPDARADAEAPPETALDSVVRQGGSLPPAPLGYRALALMLDYILVVSAGAILIFKFVLPSEFPEAHFEITEFMRKALETQGASPEPLSDDAQRALSFCHYLLMGLTWLYFTVGEVFFDGTSMGKRIFRLRTYSLILFEKPGFITGLYRSALKTLVVFFTPFLLIDVIVLFFNKRGQTGHDRLARTAVIDESKIPRPPSEHED